MTKEELTTLSVFKKDKKKFKDYVNHYDTNQQKFFGVMVKIIKDYVPEIKGLLK